MLPHYRDPYYNEIKEIPSSPCQSLQLRGGGLGFRGQRHELPQSADGSGCSRLFSRSNVPFLEAPVLIARISRKHMSGGFSWLTQFMRDYTHQRKHSY